MFNTVNDTLVEIASGIALGVLGWLTRHVQLGWRKDPKTRITPDLKLELCRQIRKLEGEVKAYQRKCDRQQAQIERLMKENAELKADRQGLVNTMAALRAKLDKFVCAK